MYDAVRQSCRRYETFDLTAIVAAETSENHKTHRFRQTLHGAQRKHLVLAAFDRADSGDISFRQLVFLTDTGTGGTVYAEAEHRVDTLIDNVDFRRVYAEVGGQVAARALAYGYHACGQTRRASILEVVQPTVYRRIIAGDTTPYKVVDCHHGRTHTAYGQRQLVAQPVVKCDIVAPQVQRYIDRAPQSARQPAVGTQARHGKLDIVAFQQRLQAIVVALCGGI